MDQLFQKPLAEATVQEIQLELIRRTSFNAFNGERVVKWLLAHRELWEAVYMDRLALMRVRRVPAAGLIKLRDLPDNYWNVDTLYILAPNADVARQMAVAIETEDWGGLVRVLDEREEVDDAMGGAEENVAIVSVWWD